MKKTVPLLVIVSAFIISSCTKSTAPGVSVAPMATVEVLRTEATIPAPNPTATYIPNTNFIKVSVWMAPYLRETLGAGLPDSLQAYFVGDAASANIKLDAGEQNVIGQWVYALASPFPTTMQGVSQYDLHLTWQGQPTGPYAGQPLLMDQATYEMFSAIWGPASPAGVTVMDRNELVDYAWTHRPAWAIVPF